VVNYTKLKDALKNKGAVDAGVGAIEYQAGHEVQNTGRNAGSGRNLLLFK